MPTNSEHAGHRSVVRRILFIVITVLALLTAYQIYRSRPAYQLQLFNTAAGWGYDVFSQGRLILHQPTIPGVAGERGFANESQARQVGERVISKLKGGKGLPTITPDELRDMNISIP
ncbi:DUF4907 domain-containing protein [uncultured Spirosoma sp.]|uniref:DUF4907 domain-containing protein n=1 Tax=uncultured Spirosoma sp. TaxID=278208 RepID=UPI002583A1DF|nr:DUF4907 domain-containing protein [uncultured Spirosoma sp.]